MSFWKEYFYECIKFNSTLKKKSELGTSFKYDFQHVQVGQKKIKKTKLVFIYQTTKQRCQVLQKFWNGRHIITTFKDNCTTFTASIYCVQTHTVFIIDLNVWLFCRYMNRNSLSIREVQTRTRFCLVQT